MPATNPKTLIEAQFSPKVKVYLYIITFFFGVFVLPLWVILAPIFIPKYFERLECELTTRSLRFKKGYIFHTERTIPLDKIQDLTFKEGPVLRALDLSILQIETAGQSQQSQSDLKLIGIVDAAQFRNRVLEQRDKVTENFASVGTDTPASEDTKAILQDIRDSLKRIEQRMTS